MERILDKPALITTLSHGLTFASDTEVNNHLLNRYCMYNYLVKSDALNKRILQSVIDDWADRANKLYETTLFEYNPIENTNRISHWTNNTVTSGTDEKTRTDNLTETTHSVDVRDRVADTTDTGSETLNGATSNTSSSNMTENAQSSGETGNTRTDNGTTGATRTEARTIADNATESSTTSNAGYDGGMVPTSSSSATKGNTRGENGTITDAGEHSSTIVDAGTQSGESQTTQTGALSGTETVENTTNKTGNQHLVDNDENTSDGTRTNTGTQKEEGSSSGTHNVTYDEDTHGNIGTMTTQQMIREERDLRMLDCLDWYVSKFASAFNLELKTIVKSILEEDEEDDDINI